MVRGWILCTSRILLVHGTTELVAEWDGVAAVSLANSAPNSPNFVVGTDASTVLMLDSWGGNGTESSTFVAVVVVVLLVAAGIVGTLSFFDPFKPIFFVLWRRSESLKRFPKPFLETLPQKKEKLSIEWWARERKPYTKKSSVCFSLLVKQDFTHKSNILKHPSSSSPLSLSLSLLFYRRRLSIHKNRSIGREHVMSSESFEERNRQKI